MEVSRYYPEFPECRGELSACANSGYQVLFSDFSNGPRYEANLALIIYLVQPSYTVPMQTSPLATP